MNFARHSAYEPGIGGGTRRDASCKGSALIECAILLPLILLLMLNAVNFGIYIYGWITVDNAARAASLYRVYNGIAVGAPAPPSFAQVQSLVTNDVSTMLNHATVSLKVCSNKNGTVTCLGTGSYTPPADPEPSTYTLYSADVAYTYQPLFSSFNLPAAGIYLTLPPTTIHRQVVMRSMQ